MEKIPTPHEHSDKSKEKGNKALQAMKAHLLHGTPLDEFLDPNDPDHTLRTNPEEIDIPPKQIPAQNKKLFKNKKGNKFADTYASHTQKDDK